MEGNAGTPEEVIVEMDEGPEQKVTISIPTTEVQLDLSAEVLSVEQRKQWRLARKPRIDHLEDGIAWVMSEPDPETGLMQKVPVPLFNVGDRIVVERYLSWAPTEWLDTRVYLVRDIDDETGFVRCIDVEANHHATVGFKHPGQTFKLCPPKGDPFSAPGRGKIVKNAGNEMGLQPKKRGRPKGSKSRPKEEIAAEKKAREEKKRKKK